LQAYFFAGDKPFQKNFPQKAANSVFKFYYSEYFVLIAADFLLTIISKFMYSLFLINDAAQKNQT
jgi:hypothetical protein